MQRFEVNLQKVVLSYLASKQKQSHQLCQ